MIEEAVKSLSQPSILSGPILDIAARLWEQPRYEAFKTCYKSMRRLDDLVDHRKAAGPLTAAESSIISRMMRDWLVMVEHDKKSEPNTADLLRVINEFQIPLWPWQKLIEAMEYDLHTHGFATFRTFLTYCEGAAIAPASVFTHLCGIRVEGRSVFPPGYDIRKAARPLALFSYLVHIMRDVEIDQERGLNYFADDIMQHCQINHTQLKADVRAGIAGDNFRALIATYARYANYYRDKSRRMLDTLSGKLESRYMLSLELIFELYSQILERFEPLPPRFSEKYLQPSTEEILARIHKTAGRFGLA